MVLHLNSELQTCIESIALESGKPPAQILTEAARFIADSDRRFWESVQRGVEADLYEQGFLEQGFLEQDFLEQDFLAGDRLEARFEALLRR